MSREEINNDEMLESVAGGFMHFDKPSMTLTYTHEETGAVTTYKILKYNTAWQMSNYYHSQGIHEDVILAKMLAEGCIG